MRDEIAFYRYDPTEETFFKEGVTTGHLVVWGGKPGPASVAKVAALVDAEGVLSVEPTGPFEPCTVVDDS